MENGLNGKRTKNHFTMRSVVDFTMGLLYIGVACFMIFAEKFGFEMIDFPKSFRIIFGCICIVYGVWRIYRGYRKDY